MTNQMTSHYELLANRCAIPADVRAQKMHAMRAWDYAMAALILSQADGTSLEERIEAEHNMQMADIRWSLANFAEQRIRREHQWALQQNRIQFVLRTRNIVAREKNQNQETHCERRTIHSLENARDFFTPWKLDDEQNEHRFELHRQFEHEDDTTLVYHLESVSKIIIHENEPPTETRFRMAQFEDDPREIAETMARIAPLRDWIVL